MGFRRRYSVKLTQNAKNREKKEGMKRQMLNISFKDVCRYHDCNKVMGTGAHTQAKYSEEDKCEQTQ